MATQLEIQGYGHPASHPPEMITEDSDHRFVTDAEKASWNAIPMYSGVGSPEAVVTAPAGSLYTNTSGGVGSTLWVKETGVGNTGWAAK